ncbi:ferric reductase-like transmembrane domain-containing protein [Alicyclobacillus shizuokensis]|uniref:ferric reductase-like transmembrane domain-containing protein n=1 Tax=Alicyclobacillus shizuokensis TaxID=392014 RepID=UPI000830E6E1|nr:ferric reductase-like transmembrane domain-containing protein [Alicyclobacillus shizuokensis]
MELVNERQTPALLSAGLFLFLMITGSYGLAHVLYHTQAGTNQFFWYMERAAGFTVYELLAASVLLGMASASGLWDRWRARKLATDLHQFIALFLLAFLALHLWGLHEDTTIPFSLQRLLLPFVSSYRPLPVALGVLGMYGVLVLILTSYLRPMIGPKVWRTIHYLSIPVFILVTLHGLLSGTDAGSHWALVLYSVPWALFLVLLVLRTRRRRTTRPA